MGNFALSKHAQEQMELRKVTLDMVESVLENPDRILDAGDGQTIYQAVIQQDSRAYLLRIFVNSVKIPNLVKTVYLTSKISKYQ